MSDPTKDIQPATHVEASDHDQVEKNQVNLPKGITQQNADFYMEALEKYGTEGSIDPKAEKRLKR